ncbi:TPA: fimbrial protein, partial [Escherichia coli]|nr:fimbrial protein [Escherichia coli]
MLNTFLFLVLLLFSFVANANFMIYPISKDVHEGGSDIIRVYSKSAETQYIKIYTKKIINPGSQNEQEVDSSNWKEGLVVSPVKLILPAGSSKSVRLTQIKKIDYEEVYRIYFESVSPQKKEHEGNIKKLNTELSVNIIYAALIRVLPENKKMSANASINTNGNIIVNNTGNVRIGIKNIYFCKGEEI